MSDTVGVMAEMAQRPVLVGMNNPISMRLEHALYPWPKSCTGYRLWQMLNESSGVSKREYLEAFERVNLVTGSWNVESARQEARKFMSLYVGRTLVLLGGEVRRAFKHPKRDSYRSGYRIVDAGAVLEIAFIDSSIVVEDSTIRFYQLPHPSGRNPWYNDSDNRRVAGELLSELYLEYVGS
jgi:hypothetical protein